MTVIAPAYVLVVADKAGWCESAVRQSVNSVAERRDPVVLAAV